MEKIVHGSLCHNVNSSPAYARETRDREGSAHAADTAFGPPVEVKGSSHRIFVRRRHYFRGTLGRLRECWAKRPRTKKCAWCMFTTRKQVHEEGEDLEVLGKV